MSIDYGTHNISTSGNLTIASGIVLTNSVPSTTTNALYNDNGTLKFNGSSVGVGGETNSNNIHPFLLGGM